VAGLGFGTTAPASATDTPAASVAGQSITLVTGDRVTVLDGRPGSVVPGPGREDVTFSVSHAEGRSYIIPADAVPLVASGRVDSRLFDITTLLEFGYHDRMPLIVTGDALPTTRSARNLPAVNGMAVDADPAGALWDELTTGPRTAGVSKIWLDGQRRSTLDRSTAQIGAPVAWDAGYTGEGVTVAVLDTGVDQTHPDLADREIAEQNFSDAPENIDRGGHGTHVASTIAGTGAASNGKYRGVASGASILDGKVLNDFGFGYDSWIIAGMQWAVDQGADVVNLSLGADDTAGLDVLEEAVNTLSAEHGTLFVVAAGNSGAEQTVGSPGSAEAALTVGAVDRNDELAGFSSRGPRVGDGGLKPDLTAPGVDIVAALHADGVIGPPVEPGYTALSGTSMATPHVAGAAALLAQQHPAWTGAQLKAALTASAEANPDLGEYAQGAGRVDVARAIGQTVVSEPTNVSLGLAAWPHDDDQPVTRSFAYRNPTAADVTLQLTLDTDAPDGMFTLSTTEVTVPAGGSADVSVTGDPRIGTTDAAFSGTVVATAGGISVRTPVGIVREVESYDLTIEYLDRAGAPATDAFAVTLGLSTPTFKVLYAEGGRTEVRLPKGRYFFDHSVITAGEHVSIITQPNVELTEDTTVTVDARAAKPIEITPPAEASMVFADIGLSFEAENVGMTGGWFIDDLSQVATAQLGASPPPGEILTGHVNTQWSGTDGSYFGLNWFTPDEMPTGLTKVVGWDELATVHVDVDAQGENRVAERALSPVETGGRPGRGVNFPLEFAVPGTRTEYLTTEGQAWTADTTVRAGDVEEITLDSPVTAYRAGRTYHERVNHGMFGPALPSTFDDSGWAFRAGDTLIVDVPLFGDSAGNGGFSPVTSGSAKVYADGDLVGSSALPGGQFAVPAGEHDYRVAVTADRGAGFALSPVVSAEWTFTSATTEAVEPAGVSALRFFPKLDDGTTAPAGRPFAVPVLLQRNDGGVTERARRLTVEVSYDEGTTWRRAPVLLNTVALLDHPAGAGTVSLRASATDSAGNTVKQTIVRAYHLA
jgi:subtilisin family serine protease